MPTKDHNTLFSEPVYVEQFANKKEFENGSPAEEVARMASLGLRGMSRKAP